MSAHDEARAAVLDRIRRATADVTETEPALDVPVAWEYGRGVQVDDVLGTFVEKVRDYKATVVEVPIAQVPAAITEALHATGATTSAVVPPGLEPTWVDAVVAAGLEAHVDTPPLTHHELDATDAVVTAATVGIADTGTIVLTHGPDQGRRALTLVPDRHVCVVLASQVVGDVPEALMRTAPLVAAGQPMTMVSGGSATSDIELSRVDGVHGPRRLHVIVVTDA